MLCLNYLLNTINSVYSVKVNGQAEEEKSSRMLQESMGGGDDEQERRL